MTELEGAILSLLQTDGPMTSYGVRRAFLDSPSAFWSGSAGAIYPALKRMEEAGLVVGEDATRGRRAARLIRLSDTGHDAVAKWAGDVKTAIGAGYDPFRIRALSWTRLPDAERASLKANLVKQIRARIEEIDAYGDDHPDADRHDLERALQTARLDWLERL